MVNTAKEEPDGLGSLAEESPLVGKFLVPKEQKVTDPGHEQLLLRATVEELGRRHASLDCRWQQIADFRTRQAERCGRTRMTGATWPFRRSSTVITKTRLNPSSGPSTNPSSSRCPTWS